MLRGDFDLALQRAATTWLRALTALDVTSFNPQGINTLLADSVR